MVAGRDESIPAMWALEDTLPKQEDKKSSSYQKKKAAQLRDDALQVAIGQQLMDISSWAGHRARAGDTESLRLLREYIELFLGAIEPVKLALVLEGEKTSDDA